MDKPTQRSGRHMMAGTLRIFLAEALILPTGFITAVFLARSLGPADYGLFALASRLMLWVEFTSVKMFSDTTVKFVSESEDFRPVAITVIWLHIIIGSVVGVLIFMAAPLLAGIFNEPDLSYFLRLFSIEIPIFCLAYANRNILTGMGRFKARARISAIRLITRLFLIVMFVEMGLSVQGAILGTIGASLVELLLSRCYVKPPLFSGNAFPLRPLCAIALPAFMTALSLRIFKMDLFALKALGGTAAEAGFYGAATNLAIPLALVSQSIASPLLSTLSHLIKNKEEAAAKKIGQTILRFILWLIPFTMLAAAAAPEIVYFVFGKTFEPAAPILSALIFATLALLTINLSKAMLISLNKPGWTFSLTGPMVPLALLGHLIMVPILGGVGAALVTAAIATLCAIASLYAIYRLWGIFPKASSLAKSLLSGTIIALLSFSWKAMGVMILAKLTLFSLAIIFLLFILKELTSKDIQYIRSMIRKKNKENQTIE